MFFITTSKQLFYLSVVIVAVAAGFLFFLAVPTAQTTSSCPSGYHLMAYYTTDYPNGFCMSDTNYSVCQPVGGGSIFTCPSYATHSTTTTSSGTSCDSALIALLGAGCHWMYNDSSGNPIFCDGSMTKSAKRGDTTTTAGCTSTTSSTSCSPETCYDAVYCTDGRDNDNDGLIDSADPACGGTGSTSITTFSLNAATDLTATYRTATKDVELKWTDNSIEESIKISRRVAGGSWGLLTTMPGVGGGTGFYIDSSLTAGTTYEYRINSCGGSNCSPDSNVASVSISSSEVIQPKIQPPVISNVVASNITSSSATITWTTDKPSNSKIEYWVSTVTGDFRYDSSFVTNHIVTLSGLAASTTYNFNVVSEDTDYYRTTVSNQKFTTLGGISSGKSQCSDGLDNDGDGLIDSPQDTGCFDSLDNDETPGGIVATTTPGAPYLTLISPNSGPIGTSVILSGSGLSATGNRVNFNGGGIMNLASADGKTLNFTVPDDRVPICAVTEPRCLLPAPYNPVVPGKYAVSVTNVQGSSNSLPFEVKEKTTSCPSGYHYMPPFAGAATGYCMSDTDSSQCQPLGGGTKYTCPGSGPVATTTPSVGDVSPPYVDYAFSSPRSGDSNVPVTTKVKVIFNEEIDPSSFGIQQFFSLREGSYTSAVAGFTPSLQGSFSIFSNGFEFTPANPLRAGTSYVWQVFPGVKDKAGNKTTGDYYATFSTASGPAVGTGSITGTVTDGKGNPVALAFVNLANYTDSFWRKTETDAKGIYKLTDIPAGAYKLSLYPPYTKSSLASPSDVTVTIEKGAELKKDLSFAASTKVIKGTVKSAEGKPITDAFISAYRQDGPGSAETESDSSGSFTLSVSGGTWQVGARPKDYAKASWTYDKSFISAAFAFDAAPETKTIDLIVLSQNSKIIGKLLKADGTVPAAYEVSVNISAPNRSYPSPQIANDGSFSVAVAPGAYEVFIWSSDPSIKISPLAVTVFENETKDLGTIKLTKPVEKITGRVLDESGKPVAGVGVGAYELRGGGSASTRTGDGGSYTISVTPGLWTVSVFSEPLSNYASVDPPQEVEVKTGAVLTQDLRVASLDATISGVVKDSLGNVVDDFFGYALVEGAKKYGGAYGAPVDRGVFNFRVAAGTHRIGLDIPPGSGWNPGNPVSVTVGKGGTAKVTLTVKKNTSAITGLVQDSKGNPILDVPVRVFAAGESGSWQETSTDKGKFLLKVSPGTWFLGASTYGYGGTGAGNYFLKGEKIKVDVSEGKTVTQNIVLLSSDATIKGRVQKPDASPMANTWVSVDSRSHGAFAETSSAAVVRDVSFSTGAETDKEGRFTVMVPSGTYYIHVYTAPERGLINPEEQKVSVGIGESVSITLSFRSPDARITGTVFLGGAPQEAFVGAWSEKGGYVETRSGRDGKYALKVSKEDVWHVYASRELKGDWYESSEAVVKVTTAADFNQDLELTREKSIPPPVTVNVTADKPSVVAVEDGTKVSVPANSVSSSGGATVTINPDPEVPKSGGAKVLGVAYEVNAFDDKGRAVTALNTAFTVTIPYDPKELEKQGISPRDLKIAFFDEAAAVWKELPASVVNEVEHTVSATVDHLTRFAIVAAADITPPEAPDNLAAGALGGGKIKITWKNPVKDFSHAKVYRSDTNSAIGSVIAFEVTAAAFTDDNNVVDGRTYYYTVRSVDPAGNESNNTNQVMVKAVGTSLKSAAEKPVEKTKTPLPAGAATKLEILRNLTPGSSGEDVKTLQELLLKEGVYPQGLVTGFFGDLTRQAVIRLQEKYSSEILAPVGLTAGNGFVGPATRKKINELLGVPSGEKTVQAPGQALKAEILRSLTVGSSGEEVKILQEFLLKEGVYPQGLITGFFGELTKQAVIRFQEKYAEEILTPVGETKGTGFVGPATLKKINAFLTK